MKKFFAIVGLAAAGAQAAALKEAEFTRVINDVKILPVEAGPAPAKVGDRITGKTGVATGVQSRAELRFPDKTLTRLGANSMFRMDQATRTVEVEKGVILLQVPKQMGGAQVRTAAVTAAITGTTVLLETTPDGYIKIIVIEGEVDVFLNEKRRAFRTLVAGDLWLTRANDKSSLPLPVKVDLKRLKQTSKLLNDAEFSQLGNEKQVQGALDDQDRQKQKGELLATSFQIEGRGRAVTLTQGERQHVLGVTVPEVRTLPTPEPVVNRKPAQTPVVLPNSPVNIPESTVFDDQSRIATQLPGATAFNSSDGTFHELPGSYFRPVQDGPFNIYMYDDPLIFTNIDQALAGQETWFVFKGDELYLSGGVVFDTTGGPQSLILGSTRDFHFTADTPFPESGITAGNHLSLDETTGALVVTSRTGSVIFDDFTLAGGAQDVLFHADGPLSDVTIIGTASAEINIPDGTFTAFAGRDVRMAESAVIARNVTMTAGRDVEVGGTDGSKARIEAKESIRVQAGRTIRVADSSQLRRLAQTDNLHIALDAVDGSVLLDDGSFVDADSVSLTSQRGDIRMTGATISAREIKGRVFDTGGVLHITNSRLNRGTNPADLIRLYGEGAGGVRFSGDTILHGNAVDIAGTAVTIDSGSRVRLSNPGGTRVFADTHNFNNGAHGNFTGIESATPVDVGKHPYAGRPAF